MSRLPISARSRKRRGVRPDSPAARFRDHVDRQVDRMNVRGLLELVILRDLLTITVQYADSMSNDHDDQCRCRFCASLSSRGRIAFASAIGTAAQGAGEALDNFKNEWGSHLLDLFGEPTFEEALIRLADLIEYAAELSTLDTHDGPTVAVKRRKKRGKVTP